MITILSPAKTLDFEPRKQLKKHTQPLYLEDARELITKLAKLSKPQVARLMSLSDKLAQLNVERYRSWALPFTPENAKQALFAFRGDVYQGFELDEWKAAELTFAQKHLRILSGLYGVLRPLDLMQPYRLEMGTPLRTKRGKDLYAFWGERLTDALRDDVRATRSKVFVNLASNEYSAAVDLAQLPVPVITPVFKDEKNGKYKIISFFAKKARGLMANYIVRNRVKNVDALRDFDVAGYRFDPDSSDDQTLVFLRDAQ